MQDEDVRQVDTTGKSLQFAYCLCKSQTCYFSINSKCHQDEEYQKTV